MAKYLSGRSKRTPQSALSDERYRYLSVGDAEPNFGDPIFPGDFPPFGQQYQIVSVEGYPGERYWVPIGGGLIPGSITVFDEGNLVGGLSSTTQVNFVGAAITVIGISGPPPGVGVTVTVFAPGNNSEILFNTSNEFSTSPKLKFDTSTGSLIAGDRIIVGTGGTVITTTGVGSVGIGTTDPTQELHLQGDFRITGTIYDYFNSPGSPTQLIAKNNFGGITWVDQGTIRSAAGGTVGNVQYHNSVGLVDGAPNFVFDEFNNRIGIGSTIPTVLLDVLGYSKFTGQTEIDNLYVTGITTLKNLGVLGLTTTKNLEVTGVATIGFLTGNNAYFTGIVTADQGFVGSIDITQLNVTGFASIKDLGVSGLTTTRDLQVYESTLLNRLKVSGISTFDSQVIINNLNVTGVGTFDNIKLDTNTVSTNIGNLIIDSSGGTTQINDIVYINDYTQSIDSNTGALVVEGGVGIGSRLNVDGAVKLATLGGITTTGGDLYVAGNLFVNNDIFYDELFARNGYFTGIVSTKDLLVTGVATIATLGVSGLTTTRTLRVTGISTFDNFIDANGGAYIDNIQIGITDNNEIDTSSGNLTIDSAGGLTTIDDRLFVTGVSTFNANTVFNANVTLGNNVGGDTVSFGSSVNTNIIPQATDTYDLGQSDSLRWRTIYAQTFSGKFIGNADTASQIATATTTGISSYFLTFVDSNNSPASYETLYTDSGITYTPSNDLLTVGKLVVTGISTFEGTSTFNGITTFTNNVFIGNSNTDKVSFAATVDSNIIPSGTRDLGSITNRWDKFYVNEIVGTVTGTISSVSITNDSSTNAIRFISFASTVNGSSSIYGDTNLTFNPSNDTVSIGGSLGIGNANPGTRLDVTGNVRLSGSVPEIELNTGGPRFRVPSSNTLTVHTGGGLSSNNNEVIRINATGVGIETSTPRYKLHVIGDTNITGLTSLGGNLVPTGNGTQDIGLPDRKWNKFYVNELVGTITGTISSVSITNDTSTAGNPIRFISFASTFSGSSSVYGDSLLTFNPTSNSLGIGVANPTAPLDVAGRVFLRRNDTLFEGGEIAFARAVDDAFTYAIDVYGNTAENARLRFIDVQSNAERATIDRSGNFIVGSGSSTGTASQPLQVTGGAYVSGNIGIGVANPSEKLQVAGNVAPDQNGTRDLGTPSLKWNRIYTNELVGTITGTISSVSITDDTNNAGNPIRFISFASTVSGSSSIYGDTNLIFDSTSNSFGINRTTTPRGILDVVSAGNTDSFVFGAGTLVNSSTPSFGYGTIVGKAVDGDFRLALQDGTGRVNQYWNAYAVSGGIHNYIRTGEPATRQQTTVNGTTGGLWSFFGAPAGSAGGTITWSQIAYMESGDFGNIWFSPRSTSTDFYINKSGNVSIGNNLSVTGVTTFAGNILPDSTANNRDIGSASQKWNRIYTNELVGTITGTISSVSITDDTNNAGNPTRYINFSSVVNGSSSIYGDTSLTFNPTSNSLGIGVASPQFTLHLGGTEVIDVANSQLLLHCGTASNSPTVIHRNDSADYYILLSNSSISPLGTWNTLRPFTINLSSGKLSSYNKQEFGGGTYIIDNLGIGVTNPTQKLQVAGNVAPDQNGTRDLGTPSLKWNRIYTNELVGTITGTISSVSITNDTSTAGNPIRFISFASTFSGSSSVYGDSLLTFNPTSNSLGIGVASPSSTLEIAGGIRVKGGSPGANGINNVGYAFNSPGDNDTGMFSSADGQLEFYSNNVEIYRINSTGNIGIGVANPTQKLQVAGNVAPDQNGTRDLGTNTLRWRTIFANTFNVAQTVNVSGVTTFNSNVRFKEDIEVDSNKTIYFGREELSWITDGPGDIGGLDYGYISFENDNNTYAIDSATGENSCLIIGVQNDSDGSGNFSDNMAIVPTGSLYLNPGGDIYKGTAANRQRIWYGEGISGNSNVSAVSRTLSESLRANVNISGGGTITATSTGFVKWSNRFIVICNGRGNHFSIDGFFDLYSPGAGTFITGVGGASGRSVTSDGIQLNAWEALYYILPLGSSSGTINNNYRIVGFTIDLDVPFNWVLICVRNGDDGKFYFPGVGAVLNSGSTVVSGPPKQVDVTLDSAGDRAFPLIDRTTSGIANLFVDDALIYNTSTNTLKTGALKIGPVNLDPGSSTPGAGRTKVESIFGTMNNTGSSGFGWNYTRGGGELDLIINRNGGNVGGINIYDFPNGSGDPDILLKLTGSGDLTVYGSITADSFNGNANTSTIQGPLTVEGLPFIKNRKTVATSYTVSADFNEMSIGPITINNGVTVTVSSGGNWTII